MEKRVPFIRGEISAAVRANPLCRDARAGGSTKCRQHPSVSGTVVVQARSIPVVALFSCARSLGNPYGTGHEEATLAIRGAPHTPRQATTTTSKNILPQSTEWAVEY